MPLSTPSRDLSRASDAVKIVSIVVHRSACGRVLRSDSASEEQLFPTGAEQSFWSVAGFRHRGIYVGDKRVIHFDTLAQTRPHWRGFVGGIRRGKSRLGLQSLSTGKAVADAARRELRQRMTNRYTNRYSFVFRNRWGTRQPLINPARCDSARCSTLQVRGCGADSTLACHVIADCDRMLTSSNSLVLANQSWCFTSPDGGRPLSRRLRSKRA